MIDQDDAEFKAEIDRISANIKKTMKKIQNIVPEKTERPPSEPTEEKQDPTPTEDGHRNEKPSPP